MGRWGEGVFEGDTDLDEASSISTDAGIELYYYEIDPEDAECKFGGKGLEATREYLNNGTLDRLFQEYATKKASFPVSKELRFIFLAALAMRLGATISPSNMETVRRSVREMRVSPKYSNPIYDTGFRNPGKIQMETALKLYKNDGTPYNFFADRCEGPGCGKAREDLAADGNLQKCGKCKEVFYCSKDCQRASWPTHKKSCKTPEKRAEQEARKNAHREWISLNV